MLRDSTAPFYTSARMPVLIVKQVESSRYARDFGRLLNTTLSIY